MSKNDLVFLTTEYPNEELSTRADVIVIDEDRYGGNHSGYEYTAWINRRPDAITSNNMRCHEFWLNNKVIFGGGNTPDLAVRHLLVKLNKLIDQPAKGSVNQYVKCRPRFIFYTGTYDGALNHQENRMVSIEGDQRFPLLYPATEIFIKNITEQNDSKLFLG